MSKPQASPGRRRLGQVLAEFCLVLPILIFIFAGIIDMGYYLYVNISLHTAVREGAQLCMYDRYYNDNTVKDRIIQAAYGAPLTRNEITVNQNIRMNMNGRSVVAFSIDVNHRHNMLIPFAFFSSDQSVQIRSVVKSMVVTGLTP